MAKTIDTKSSKQSTEFERFKELTRLIVQVPKSEISKQQKARVRKRSRNKKHE